MARKKLFPMHQSVNHTLKRYNINLYVLIYHCMYQLLDKYKSSMSRGWIISCNNCN